jgi:hypothetical protein
MAFNPMQGQGMVQITKRPITDEEQANALVFYNSLRNGSRGISVGSMFLAVLNVGVLSGAIPLAEMAILFMVLALAIGLGAMALGGMTLKARKQIDTAFKEGYVIEVRAPAYLNRTGGNKGPMYNIGPVSVLQTPETQALLVEGAPALVVCIPGVGAALSVNGVVLKRGAMVKMPPNLAQMATPLQGASMYPPAPPLPPLPQPPQSQPQTQQFQPQPQQPQYQPQPAQYQQAPQQAQQPYPQQPYPQQAQQPYTQQPYPQQPQQPYTQQPYPQQPQQPYPQQQPYQQPQQPYPQQPYPQQAQQPYPPQPVAGPPPAGQK